MTLVTTNLTRAGLLISQSHKACSWSVSRMRRSVADRLRRVRLSVTNHSISPSVNGYQYLSSCLFNCPLAESVCAGLWLAWYNS
ncbi:hypothetical protein D3C81_1559100 [compost metagenome]